MCSVDNGRDCIRDEGPGGQRGQGDRLRWHRLWIDHLWAQPEQQQQRRFGLNPAGLLHCHVVPIGLPGASGKMDSIHRIRLFLR